MNAPEPVKLTPTQRLHEVTLAALTKTSRPPSESVEISRNAKGDAQFTVSVVTVEGETLASANDRAQKEYDRLCKQYPHTNGGETK